MLSQAHRRSIHASLTPVLGEEETEALMSEFPASESDMPATKTDLAFAVTDLKFVMKEQDAAMHDLFRQMAMWTVGAVIGGMGLSAAIAAGIAQTVGGG